MSPNWSAYTLQCFHSSFILPWISLMPQANCLQFGLTYPCQFKMGEMQGNNFMVLKAQIQLCKQAGNCSAEWGDTDCLVPYLRKLMLDKKVGAIELCTLLWGMLNGTGLHSLKTHAKSAGFVCLATPSLRAGRLHPCPLGQESTCCATKAQWDGGSWSPRTSALHPHICIYLLLNSEICKNKKY